MTLQEYATVGMPEDEQAAIYSDAQSNQITATAAIHARIGVLRGRRRITRESGQALERISHAADYLLDSYSHLGPVGEKVYGATPEMDAIYLLVNARNRILESLPVVQPLHQRVWHTLVSRKPEQQMPYLGA